jgi:hypothetical protein
LQSKTFLVLFFADIFRSNYIDKFFEKIRRSFRRHGGIGLAGGLAILRWNRKLRITAADGRIDDYNLNILGELVYAEHEYFSKKNR